MPKSTRKSTPEAAPKATLKELAEECGVSINTVSRALNGKTKAAWASSAERLARIQAAAERRGYQPNWAARAMRKRKTMQIGFLTRDLSNPISSERVEVYSEELGSRGYKLLLGLTRGERPDAFLADFSAGLVDGVVNYDPTVETRELAERLTVPLVSPLRNDRWSPVRFDFAGAIRAAMEHVWSQGHRRIGFIRGADTAVREEAYRGFLAEAGVAVPEAWVAAGDGTIEAGEREALGLRDAGCTAVVAANDMTAIGVIRAAEQAGLRVPEDLSVVGFDDTAWATIVSPELTTIALPTRSVATITVEALLARIDSRRPRPRQTLESSLKVRESTGPAPG